MFNLLTGDRLWNRYRVEDAQGHGAEGAWLSPLQESPDRNCPSRFLLLPMSQPARQPLAALLAMVGTRLHHHIVLSTPRKGRRSRKEQAAAQNIIPERLPLLGNVEWVGDPSRDGVAVIAALPAVPLTQFMENHGALSPEQVLPLAIQFSHSLQELLALLSTSRRPMTVSQPLLSALVKLLNPDQLALRTDKSELAVRVDLAPAPSPIEPPAWADFVAPEAYRNEDITPASVVFSAARVIAFLLGVSAPAALSPSRRNKRRESLRPWAALADWASGKRDPARELSADPVARQLPRPLLDVLANAVARKRSGRLASPEKLFLRLKSPEFLKLQESARCAACGFVFRKVQMPCECCGAEQHVDSAAASQQPGPSRSSGRIRRGTTSIVKGKAAAQTAVLPKIQGMTVIDAGSFLSGEERTPRTLRAFAIDTLPVTEGDYKHFLAETGKAARSGGPGSREAVYDKHPAIAVTWYEANEYAEYYGKRLPTIYEWEKAARGTDGRKFTFGNEYKQGVGRLRTFEDGRKTAETGTAAVGSYPAGASPYGVQDMSGNVLQWTSSARRAGERLFRAVKGSCYLDGSSELARCTSIQYLPPETSEPFLGFRCVKDLE